MARIRTIKPTIWTDQRFVQLSPMARLLVIGMISHADDQGRLFASVTRLAGEVFPNDELKPAQVRGWRDEIVQSGFVQLYDVSGVEYAWFPKWKRHQRISKPQQSVLPAPSTDSATECGTVPHSPEEPFPTEPERIPQPVVSLAGGGAGVTEREGEGKEEPPLPPEPGGKRTPRRGTPAPDLFPVTDEMRQWADRRQITADLDRETERFLDHHRAKGSIFKDWHAGWRTWMNGTLNYGSGRQRPGPRADVPVSQRWMQVNQ